ncbi:hypothetical protein LTR53_002616 [Teratosphaeriaceae sp. CCFEE 6253]|nr:hypothetical protein LTR53_002616 [Teratosphaeriaceae sp. CCFEE 6253]
MSRPTITPAKPFAKDVQEVVTLQDITHQIINCATVADCATTQANAEVLFPREQDLKVISAQVPTGLMHYASLVASDPKSASVHNVGRSHERHGLAHQLIPKQEYKIVLTGPGEKNRRDSMMKLLEETERRAAKQILKK